jgi:hypothetical protein
MRTCHRFQDFRKLDIETKEAKAKLKGPLSQRMKLTAFYFDIEEAPNNLQLDVTDLQSHMEVKQKFTSVKLAKVLDF